MEIGERTSTPSTLGQVAAHLWLLLLVCCSWERDFYWLAIHGVAD